MQDKSIDFENGKGADATVAEQGRDTARGTIGLFAAHAMLLPVGWLVAGFLTRQLGPELYGIFSVTGSIILWVSNTGSKFFRGTTVKFIAEAQDWKWVGSTLVRAQLFTGLIATALLVIVAPFLSAWFNSPELTPFLRLFALQIPLLALVRSHQSLLMGRSAFGKATVLVFVYGLSRLVLVLALVGAGLSLNGGILATIGATLVQFVVARYFIRLPIFWRSGFPLRPLVNYALPLFLYSLAMSAFGRADLIAVKALAESSDAAGFYGAAQALIVPFGLFAASFSSPLLATLSGMFNRGQNDGFRLIAQQAMRLVLCLLPFGGAVAGAASEIAVLLYGHEFAPTGQLFALLIFASMANVMVVTTVGILTAAGRPNWPFALAGPLSLIFLAVLLAVTPRLGAAGAAATTAGMAWLVAGVLMLAVYRRCHVLPSTATIFRISLTTLITFFLSNNWRVTSFWFVAKLGVLGLVILAGLYLLGELQKRDVAFALSLSRRQKSSID
ncbi:MAG: oligosaccharide flippase family protein [Anaerolineales bacterium]|nr:oligosaccharide flippase family protein [Anaerolineales bacterium]